MMLFAALAGLAVAGGLVLLVAEVTRPAPAPGRPASRRPLSVPSGTGMRRLALAAAAGLLTLAITRWPVAALAAVAAVLFLPSLTLLDGQRQRTAKLEGLEHWIRRLADMLTASRGLEDALALSARSAPAPIAGPVGILAARLSARTGTEAALRAFAAEIDDPAGDRIAAALIIASGRRGGAASEVLAALAAMLARDVAARREIDAERAQHRTTVKWIAGFVLGFTIFAAANRSYSAPYGTVTGQLVLAAIAAVYAAGLGWLHHLGKARAPGRFLNQAGHPSGPDSAAQDGARGGAQDGARGGAQDGARGGAPGGRRRA